MTTKITKKDNFKALAALAKAAGNTALVEFCEHEIELLNKKATAAKAASAKRKSEGDEITDLVRAALTAELSTIAAITERIGRDDVTTSKVQYRLNQLVANGEAQKAKISIPSTTGGKAREAVAFATV